jgi:uncharacterized protein
MDIFLIIISGILIFLGLLGSVLPILPGIPLSYLGILLLHFTDKHSFSVEFLVSWAIIVIVVSILDYLIPVWGAKKFGGSKKGIWGCSIGLIAGVFMGPFGIIIGPFVGAFIGELLSNKSSKDALRAAFGSFIGLLIGIAGKLVVAGFFVYYYLITIF